MGPIVREAVMERLEQMEALDPISRRLQNIARKVIPQDSQLKDALSGTWLGHPVHPPLTDVVIGAWVSAGYLDLFGGENSEDAADRLVALGVVAGVPPRWPGSRIGRNYSTAFAALVRYTRSLTPPLLDCRVCRGLLAIEVDEGSASDFQWWESGSQPARRGSEDISHSEREWVSTRPCSSRCQQNGRPSSTRAGSRTESWPRPRWMEYQSRS